MARGPWQCTVTRDYYTASELEVHCVAEDQTYTVPKSAVCEADWGSAPSSDEIGGFTVHSQQQPPPAPNQRLKCDRCTDAPAMMVSMH